VSQLDDIMEQAGRALTQGDYFQCEKLADKALHTAWNNENYDLIARIAMPLQEARRQRVLAALELAGDDITIFDEPYPDLATDLESDETTTAPPPIQPGCTIFQPPCVGADARRFAMIALETETPIITFAIEPQTQTGLLPIVSVGPTIIRTYVQPPETMDPAWCIEAINTLGRAAIESLDAKRPPNRLVNDLMDLLDSLPESEALHIQLAQTATLSKQIQQ